MQTIATNYTRKGWAVFPLTPNSKTPALKNWQTAGTCDPTAIRFWETQYPNCNYGFVPATANRIVIDIDAHNAEKDGRKSLADWERKNGKTLPKTYTVTTPNGGLHLYYIVPQGYSLGKKTNYLPGVDIIHSTGYVVIPGSTLDGKAYEADDTDTAVLPDWAAEAFLEAASPAPSQPKAQPQAGSAAKSEDLAMILEELRSLDTIEDGNRDNRLFALCADWKERGANERLLNGLLGLLNDLGKIDPGSEPKTEEDFRRIARSAWNRKETAYGSQTLDALFPDTPQSKQEKRRKAYSAAELHTMDIPETKFFVKDFLPEGISILAGQAKAGKTFLTLDLAASLADGTPFLGRESAKCRVLYCNLESSPGQTKRRLQSIKGDFYDFPEDLHLMHDLPPLALGGLKRLKEEIKEIKPELVIIDTWQKVRSESGPRNATAYAKEYLELSELRNALYSDLGVSVLLVHHLKQVPKGAISDPVQLLNGSSAIGGAVDTILVLNRERGAEEATLSAHGRDVQDVAVSLVKTEPMGWRVIEDGEDGGSSLDLKGHTTFQEDIIRILKECPEGARARDVVMKMGGDARYDSVLRQLTRWYHEGKVDRVGKLFRAFEAEVEKEVGEGDEDPFGL